VVEDRQKIWNGFFRKLAKERAGKIQVAPGAKKWVLEMAVKGTAQLNGEISVMPSKRQLRSPKQSVRKIRIRSSTMTVVVDQSHFQRVLDISNKFHEYVRSIRREDEKKRQQGG